MSLRNASVTILISIHNGADKMDRCFESLWQQTYDDFNIVCIDDASRDETAIKIARWQERFGPDRFHFLTNSENIGLTKSLVKGFAHIQSLYTARIDADDWWEPEKLQKQTTFLETHPGYGIVGCNYINHGRGFEKKIRLPQTHNEILARFFRRNPFAHSCVLFRTDLIRSLGGYNPSIRYAQDYDLWFRCFAKTKFANLPGFLCHRSLDSYISVNHQADQMKTYIQILLKYLRLYHRSLSEYIVLLEPIAIIITPTWLRKMKRRFIP